MNGQLKLTEKTKTTITYANSKEGEERSSLIALIRNGIITYISVHIGEGMAIASYSKIKGRWTATSVFDTICTQLSAEDDFEELKKYDLPKGLIMCLATIGGSR